MKEKSLKSESIEMKTRFLIHVVPRELTALRVLPALGAGTCWLCRMVSFSQDVDQTASRPPPPREGLPIGWRSQQTLCWKSLCLEVLFA